MPSPLLARRGRGALLTALTDLRLVLAERLGLRTDEDADVLHEQLARRLAEGVPQDAWSAAAAVYDFLTWWQESLVAALSSRPCPALAPPSASPA